MDAYTKAEFLELMRDVVLHRVRPYITLALMGLTDVADTMVGDESLRGVSGGQRKRVTTAEVLAGPQWAMMMDEISTGLDSATTYSVVRTMRDACHALSRTIVISLLQPAPEVMGLFDDLLLLTDGRVIYHGPLDGALPFFASLGFECPPRKDLASFLQEVTTPLGQLTYASEATLDAHNVPPALRDPAKLLVKPPQRLLVPVAAIAEAFWGSPTGAEMARRLDKEPFDPAKGHPGALARSHYARSGPRLALLTLKRQMVLVARDKRYYIARSVQAVIMGLVISSLFASVGPPAPDDPDYATAVFNQGRKALSLLVFSIIYLSMSSMPSLGFVFNTKRVFYKHRDNHYFPSWSYVVGLLVAQTPSSTVESLLFTLVVYFISGLTRSASCFFIFLLVVWSSSNCLAGLFRLIAYLSPSMVVGNAFGALTLLLMMITNGFSIVRTSIPPYLIWIYWGLNPLSYAIRALAVNELTAPRWGAAGDVILESFGLFTDSEWIWIGVGYMWGFLLLLTAAGAVALQLTNPPGVKPSVPQETMKEEVERELSSYIQRCRVGSRDAAAGGPTAAAAAAAVAAAPAPAMESLASTDSVFERLPSDAIPGPSPGVSGVTDAAAAGDDPLAVAFVPITLVCRDICYYVADPSGGAAPGVVRDSADKDLAGKLQLLQNVDFYARPGELVALMGGSGAGKTTLMDVVAGRKTQGIIRGDILVNGRPKEQATWSRVVGYVEQMDIHSSRITVKESLAFSARLRLDEATVSDAAVAAIVEQTLDTVELRPLANKIVGEPGGEGLSIEQRKRLSIAVELVANPSVLFMDEPTSGLDARAAAIVMRSVRNVANSNRTVMVTIHQPSMEIFEAFDQLVLMQRGGRLTYFGPLGLESAQLIAYLEGYPGVEPIRASYNPATWMLEVTGGSMATTFSAAAVDFPVAYRDSALRQANLEEMDRLVAASSAAAPPLAVGGRHAASLRTQGRELLKKYFAYYWRAANYNFVRILLTLLIALIYGLTYLNEGKPLRAGSTEPVSIDTVQNVMGLLFSMAVFQGMLNAMTSMPVISAERTVFYRESAASMYAPRMLSFAQGLAELPYLAVQAVTMVSITYWMCGFQPVAWKFFYFLLMFAETITMYTFLGQFLIYMTPNQLMAQLLAAFANQIWTLFNGFLVPYPQIPVGWQWMARISPTTWIIYGLGASQMGDCDVPFQLGGTNATTTTTVGEFVQSFWGYDYDFIWWCPLILFAYVLFFRVGASLLMSYVSFNKR